MENKEKTCDPRHSTHFLQLYTWPQWKCGWMATCETSEQALSPLLRGRMSYLTQAFAAAPFNSPSYHHLAGNGPNRPFHPPFLTPRQTTDRGRQTPAPLPCCK